MTTHCFRLARHKTGNNKIDCGIIPGMRVKLTIISKTGKKRREIKLSGELTKPTICSTAGFQATVRFKKVPYFLDQPRDEFTIIYYAHSGTVTIVYL